MVTSSKLVAKTSKKGTKINLWVRVIVSFFVISIIFSFTGPTGFIFLGLFIFAVVFKFVLNVTWLEAFKLGTINIIFNILIIIWYLRFIFMGYGILFGFIQFFGGIFLTKIFINENNIIKT